MNFQDETCDHEFDGETCEECGAHVSEYVEALRARIAELEIEYRTAPAPRCEDCAAEFSCFNGSAPCRKKPAPATLSEQDLRCAECGATGKTGQTGFHSSGCVAGSFESVVPVPKPKPATAADPTQVQYERGCDYCAPYHREQVGPCPECGYLPLRGAPLSGRERALLVAARGISWRGVDDCEALDAALAQYVEVPK